MTYENLKFLDDMLEVVDRSLILFYFDVIGEDTLDKKTLRKLRWKYVKKVRKGKPLSIDFGSPDVRSAYIFYYCPCFTSALTHAFVQFLRDVPDFVDRILSQDKLVVCSLGGGPATEIVAISGVVTAILSSGLSTRSKPLTIDAVVVDTDPGWKETAGRVISKLQEQNDATALQLNFRFLEHDLVSTQSVPEELREVLGRSDLVTTVKFLSAMHGENNTGVRSKIIQNICESMQDNGTLFLLDSSGWKFLDEVEGCIRSAENMSCTYGPSKQTHRMSNASKKTCSKLYQKDSGFRHCAFRSINKVSAWCKKSSPAQMNGDKTGLPNGYLK